MSRGGTLRAAETGPMALAQTVKAVAWSFFGVRRAADHRRDLARVNPIHLVVAGVAGGAVFVLLLVLLVRWIVASGVAA